MSVNRCAAIILITIASLARLSAREIERIWVDGEVNGKPVRFAFDSGSFISMLTRQTAAKLGLHLRPPQTDVFLSVPKGKRYLDFTEECVIKVGLIEGPYSFGVLDAPPSAFPELEALLGWSTVTNAIVCIDAIAGAVTFRDNVPLLATEWPHVRAIPLYNGLCLEISQSSHGSSFLEVDTGCDTGVALPPRAWRKWKKAHPGAPLTLETGYTPSDGFYVYEEAWADNISFGSITFNNVPIQEAGPSGLQELGGQYEGTIGLAALKRLELVVDSSHQIAYLRQRKSSFSYSSYNRLAAVFTGTSKHPDEPVARVMKGGPAYAAGVRNGDVLLQVDGINATRSNDNWRSRFELPAGTTLKLSLKRNGKSFQTTVTLSEILQPLASSN